jgi:2-polyprenyl-3-methyl-5-hydroxy-6-metoxy-1,4-benzoquinol methylase
MGADVDALDIDFPASIARAFPEAFAYAWPATQQVLRNIAGADLSRLARRSPALAGFAWTHYLRCSVVRLVRALDGLRRSGVRCGRVLDLGSYFGNASLMCRAAGYDVDALDAYGEYRPALDSCVSAMRDAGITVRDFADAGPELVLLPEASYDAVLCLGVVEHVPHTPRLLLEAIDRLLRRGGVLVLDTPNIAYLYNRQRLARGQSIMAPLETQYYTELPFEGHHREYTVAEVRWMLNAIGHEIVALDTFNYSMYSLPSLSGDDLANYRQMEAEPDAREIILALSRHRGEAS